MGKIRPRPAACRRSPLPSPSARDFSSAKGSISRFARAFAASYEFINDPRNRGEVTNVIMESLKVSEEIVRQIFAPYLEPDKNVLPRRGELNLKAFDQVLQLMGEAGVVPTPVPAAGRFIDLRYLQAAGIQ